LEETDLGRRKKLQKYINGNQHIMLTYGEKNAAAAVLLLNQFLPTYFC